MRLPARHAPLLFSAMLSAIMVAIVSAFVLVSTQGVHHGLPVQWLRSCLRTWPVAFPTVFVVAPLVRRTVARLTAAVLLFLLVPGASAQSAPSHPARWEFLIASGKLLPTGAQRASIARGGVIAAQLTFVPGPIAVTATLGWARTRDAGTEEGQQVNAFLYDIGAEGRAPLVRLWSVTLMPFGGGGVGGRSYDYRGAALDAVHNLTAFVSAGGELGLGRVRLRLEARDYLSRAAAHQGGGGAAMRNDVVVMMGLRLGAPR